MSEIQCFWIEPTEMARSELRRYERHSYDPMPPPSCPQNSMRYHDTSVYIGDVPYLFTEDGRLGEEGKLSHDDPRWPKACDVCGCLFRDEDYWQHNLLRLFRGAPDGKLYTVRNAPPGAMYDAYWWRVKGPDGIALAVCLPPNGGDDVWHPDSPSSSGGAWMRTGTIPNVTCTPSILTPRYHGFLTNGKLVSC
jgi:hypothetical protein